jgi:hypothetical protein
MSAETEAMWKTLSKLAMDDRRLHIAERYGFLYIFLQVDLFIEKKYSKRFDCYITMYYLYVQMFFCSG